MEFGGVGSYMGEENSPGQINFEEESEILRLITVIELRIFLINFVLTYLT